MEYIATQNCKSCKHTGRCDHVPGDDCFEPRAMVCFQYEGDGLFDESRVFGSLLMLEGLRRLRDWQKFGPSTTNGKTSHILTVTE